MRYFKLAILTMVIPTLFLLGIGSIGCGTTISNPSSLGTISRPVVTPTTGEPDGGDGDQGGGQALPGEICTGDGFIASVHNYLSGGVFQPYTLMDLATCVDPDSKTVVYCDKGLCEQILDTNTVYIVNSDPDGDNGIFANGGGSTHRGCAGGFIHIETIHTCLDPTDPSCTITSPDLTDLVCQITADTYLVDLVSPHPCKAIFNTDKKVYEIKGPVVIDPGVILTAEAVRGIMVMGGDLVIYGTLLINSALDNRFLIMMDGPGNILIKNGQIVANGNIAALDGIDIAIKAYDREVSFDNAAIYSNGLFGIKECGKGGYIRIDAGMLVATSDFMVGASGGVGSIGGDGGTIFMSSGYGTVSSDFMVNGGKGLYGGGAGGVFYNLKQAKELVFSGNVEANGGMATACFCELGDAGGDGRIFNINCDDTDLLIIAGAFSATGGGANGPNANPGDGGLISYRSKDLTKIINNEATNIVDGGSSPSGNGEAGIVEKIENIGGICESGPFIGFLE
jgi:hypothetical protein